MRKKLFISAIISLGGIFCSNAAVDEVVEPLWGPADTVESHMVGPGINYTKIIYPDMPLILWYTVVDLTNEHNKIEQVQSRHAVPDVLRWDVQTHYKQNSRPGHQVKVAWNHDFFSYDAGICIGANISEGEMTWCKWGRSLLAITKDKKAEIFNPNGYVAEVIAPDGTKVWIDRYNKSATSLDGDCILFNRMNSLTLDMVGKYIKIEPQGEWLVNGAPIKCKVLEISDSPLQTSATEYVIYLRNGKQNQLDGHINVGGTLEISQWFDGASWGTPPANILNAFHGYPSIARDGKFHDGEYNNFENGREYEKSSHVMVGINKDKTQLHVLINEMSGQSKAVDCVELTSWMINRGAWDVVNFDSGGSAAIVIDEEMLNLPGRGSLRPVQDAMLAVSLAPEDNNVDRYTFSKPSINPSVISVTPLRVMGFNQYDEVLEKEVSGCTFTCEPSDIGYVDAQGMFHSSSKAGIGKIIAEKDGKKAELKVTTRAAGNVYPRITDVVIDDNRQYLLEIIGETPTEKFNLDPVAFDWSVSNDNCVIENGMLKGVKNGTSVITGKFENISFDINVSVEIVQPIVVVDNFADISTFSPTFSGVKNLAKVENSLPEGWSDGSTFKFDISSSRGAYIKLNKESVLKSLPDSISFEMIDSENLINVVGITYQDALGNKYTKSITRADNTDNLYVVPFTESDNSVFEVAKYPITLKTIQLTFKNSTTGTGKELSFRNLIAHHPAGSGSVNDTEISIDKGSKLQLSIEPEIVNAKFWSNVSGKAEVAMFSTTGNLISRQRVDCNAGENNVAISTKEATTGIYIVTVTTSNGMLAAKCILK